MRNRLVCKCLNVYMDEIKLSYIKNNGDIEKIKEDTQAALACRECIKIGCFKVDISFTEAIEEIKAKCI